MQLKIHALLVLGVLTSLSVFAGPGKEGKAKTEIAPDSVSTAVDTAEVSKFTDYFSASTKITNQHMWRAFASGTAPCIEPYLSYSYKGLSVSAWSAYALDNSYKEFDIFIKYNWKFFQLGVFDYFCPEPEVTNNEYTNFTSDDTRHLYEVQLNYLGHKYFPVNILTGCFVGGCDIDEYGNQLYSTYAEVNYTFTRKKNKLKVEVGLTPFKGMFADEFSVFNYGLTLLRDIKITENFSIPSSYKLVYNKELNDVYFSVGFVLR